MRGCKAANLAMLMEVCVFLKMHVMITLPDTINLRTQSHPTVLFREKKKHHQLHLFSLQFVTLQSVVQKKVCGTKQIFALLAFHASPSNCCYHNYQLIYLHYRHLPINTNLFSHFSGPSKEEPTFLTHFMQTLAPP